MISVSVFVIWFTLGAVCSSTVGLASRRYCLIALRATPRQSSHRRGWRPSVLATMNAARSLTPNYVR